MKKFLLFTFIIGYINVLFCQELKPDRKFVNKFYDAEAFMYEGNYTEAAPLLLDLYNLDPDNANIQYKLGYCYLMSRMTKKEALDYLKYSADYISLKYKSDDHKERKAPIEALYYLGQAYRYNYKFDKSLEVLNDLIGRLNPRKKEDAKLIKLAEREIEITNNARNFYETPNSDEVKNMGGAINTEYSDHSPAVDLNEEFLYFTSKRPKTGERDINQDEDIFMSKNKNFVWQDAVRLDAPINSEKNEASIGISPDARSMFIFRSENYQLGNVLVTHTNNNSIWTTPTSIGANINSKYRETHASLTPDGNTLYFVSDREGGIGGRDIYVMHLMPDNNWGTPKLLGPEINTIYDEETPFMHPDGVTFFFSSQGHSSMGGYDVFKTKQIGQDKFSEPENLGYPINTPDDEVSYILSLDGRKAYMASSRDGGYGDLDIYEITISDVYINTSVVFNGVVTDIDNNIPKNLKIKVYNKKDDSLVGIYRSGNKGYFLILQPGCEYMIQYEADGYLIATANVSPQKENVQSFMKKYVPIPLDPVVLLAYKYQNYVYFDKGSEHFNPQSTQVLDDVISKNKLSDKLIINLNYVPGKEREILSRQRGENIVDYLTRNGIDEKDIYLNGKFPAGYKDVYCLDMREIEEPIAVVRTDQQNETNRTFGDTVVIENVFFDFDRYDILSKYNNNLNILANYLKNNPSASIEIGGHTDWLGTNEYNYLLSYKRSKAVKDYLVAKGANPENLITVKYGESDPIADNAFPSGADNPAGRQLNRRAEFKVLQQGTEALLYVKPIVIPESLASAGIDTRAAQTATHSSNQSAKFTIQIMALRNEVPVDRFADLVGVKLHKSDDGWFRYYVGAFTSFREAKASLEQLKSMGYEPFIQKLSFFE